MGGFGRAREIVSTGGSAAGLSLSGRGQVRLLLGWPWSCLFVEGIHREQKVASTRGSAAGQGGCEGLRLLARRGRGGIGYLLEELTVSKRRCLPVGWPRVGTAKDGSSGSTMDLSVNSPGTSKTSSHTFTTFPCIFQSCRKTALWIIFCR